MFSLRLWRELHNPPDHTPLFDHALRLQGGYSPLERLRREYGLWLSLGTLALVYLVLIFRPLVILTLPLFAGSVLGAYWAIDIAGAIGYERQRGTHDLLCLTPDGMPAVYRALATASIYRGNLISWLQVIINATRMIGGAVLVVILTAIVLQAGSKNPETQQIVLRETRTLLLAVSVLVIIYADQIQSVVLGTLVGQLSATLHHAVLDARLWALAMFSILQISVYLFCALVLVWLLPLLLADFPLMARSISLAVLRLTAFMGLREIIIMMVARRLAAEMGKR